MTKIRNYERTVKEFLTFNWIKLFKILMSTKVDVAILVRQVNNLLLGEQGQFNRA